MKLCSSILRRRLFAPLLFSLALILVFSHSNNAQTGIAAADRQLNLWRGFAPPDGKFNVSLPAQPEGATIPLERENISLMFHVFESKKSGSIYGVGYVDFPVVAKDAELIEMGFDGGRDTILKNKSAVLLSEKKIAFKNYPGRELKMKEGSNVTKVQMILVKERLFTIYCSTPILQNMPEAISKIYQAESDKFFNSFDIVDNKKSTATDKH